MAITMMAQIPAGFLPTEVGPGPFPDGGALAKWWTVRIDLLAVIELCVDEGEGGLRWFGKLERSFLGPIGRFRY